jgi:hypothetical protein
VDVGSGVLVDTLQHIDQVVVGVDVVQPAGHDQALDGGDRLGADLTPTEHPVLSIMPSSA